MGVDRDGMAAANGIRTGDVITSVNNRQVNEPSEVIASIEKAKRDEREKIVVLLLRNGNSRFIPLDLTDN